jgi:hypothetical protein
VLLTDIRHIARDEQLQLIQMPTGQCRDRRLGIAIDLTGKQHPALRR